MIDESAVNTRFSDVFVAHDPEPTSRAHKTWAHQTVTYRSGLVAYQESLIRGQFVGRSWNGSGYTNPEAERFDPALHPAPQAFWVELDGQLLWSHWEWRDLTQSEDTNGLTSYSGTPPHGPPCGNPSPHTLGWHTYLDALAGDRQLL